MKNRHAFSMLFTALIYYSAQAQPGLPGHLLKAVVSAPLSQNNNPMPAAVTQTLTPLGFSLPCAASKWWYYFDNALPIDTGYAFGNNIYGESECAQQYKTVSGTVSEVLAWYGRTAGTTGATTAKIYSINATTLAPQAVLGTSGTVTTGSISTSGYTFYSFSPAVSVTNGFFAAVKLPTTAGDTAVLYVDSLGCYFSPDSTAWEKYGSTWWSVPRNYGPAFNNDLCILAVADVSIGVNEYSSGELSLLGTSPNPATDRTTIHYRLSETSDISIRVFDLIGKTVFETSESSLGAGFHEQKVSLKEFIAGNYYYTIRTRTSKLTGKLVVIK